LALHWSGWLTVAELKTLDHRFHRYADSTKAGNDIVLVAVDEASLEAYGRWPWPRDRHGYVVHYLKQAGVKAVVFDILFLEPDSADEEFDEVFAQEMRAAGNVYLPFLMQDQPEPSADSTVSPPACRALPDILKKATIALDDQEPQPTEPSRPGRRREIAHASARSGCSRPRIYQPDPGHRRNHPSPAPAGPSTDQRSCTSPRRLRATSLLRITPLRQRELRLDR
jgi:CHASE2 domain-containing sensor protein